MINPITVGTIIALGCGVVDLYANTAPPVEHIDPSRAGKVVRESMPARAQLPTSVKVKERTRNISQAKNSRDLRFKFKELIIEGVTAFNVSQLEKKYSAAIGEEISLNELYQIARHITQYYRDNGYILSQVVIPPQKIKDGVVRVKVIEGFVDEITITADDLNSQTRALLQDYAYHVSKKRPLHIDILERYALLSDDIPGLAAKTYVQPSKHTLGAADLSMAVEVKKYEGVATIDNRMGRRYGSSATTIAGYVNNLMGGSRTGLLYKTSTFNNYLNVYNFTHTEHIGNEGLKLSLVAQYVKNNPFVRSDGFDLDVSSHSTLVAANLIYPWIRSRQKTLTLQGGIEVQRSYSEHRILGTVIRKTDDRLRTAQLGLTLEYLDRFRGSNLFSFEISKGFKAFGATNNSSLEKSRAGGRADFAKIDVDFSRMQFLSKNFSLMLALEGQYAFHELLSPEEFGIGGAQLGRGYNGSEIVGDHGLASKLELRFSQSPYNFIINSYQCYAFLDSGMVWNINRDTQTARESLVSAGLGVRLNFKRHIAGNVELAKPVSRMVSSRANKHPRLFFSITAWA